MDFDVPWSPWESLGIPGNPTNGMACKSVAMSGAVVVQKLFREGSASGRRCRSSRNVTIDKERASLTPTDQTATERLATCDHFKGIVCRDVPRKKIGAASLIDARPHAVDDLRDAFVLLAANLIPVRLTVLDDMPSFPLYAGPKGLR